jgi:hypothetical protein
LTFTRMGEENIKVGKGKDGTDVDALEISSI